MKPDPAASPPPDASRDASPEAAVEAAMVRLRRGMAKRTMGRQAAEAMGGSVDVSLFLVNDAVEEGPPIGEDGVTVGLVAERMAVDPSRASRLVSAAIKAGYIRRVASQADGRRVNLELTDAGRALSDELHRFRRAYLARAMARWTDEERATFARLLTRFVDKDEGPPEEQRGAAL
jgi:DNA-binding MarR family transcriptional regulator